MKILISLGWKREDLEEAERNGAEYSAKRSSLWYPLEFGDESI
jgi:hypothetical protein